ncbi:MAG: peptidylprolyl isomerase [Myxococcota bacterium]
MVSWLVSLWMFASVSAAAIVDRVAAVVNGDVITLSEVYEFAGDFIEQRATSSTERRDAELEVLDSLILRRLISQEIERLGLDVTDVELDRTIDDIANRNQLSREELRREIERSGLPWSEYRLELQENLRQSKFNQAIIQPRITINDDELKDAYRRLLSGSELPEIADVGAIYLAPPPELGDVDLNTLTPEQRAVAEEQIQIIQNQQIELQRLIETIKARADAGEDFAALSAEYDQGPYGAQGGKMGSYREGELVPALNDPVFALDVGETSAPVATAQGVFILHVFDRYEEEPPPFEDVRDQLTEQVYAGRIDAETDLWYQQTRRRSAIQIKLQELD